MDNIPEEISDAIKEDNKRITIQLETENAADKIKGYGHPN